MTDDVILRVARRISYSVPLHCGRAAPLARDVLSALRPGDVLPNGCVVVPKDPTDAMVRAGYAALERGAYEDTDPINDSIYTPVPPTISRYVYAAMLAAAEGGE